MIVPEGLLQTMHPAFFRQSFDGQNLGSIGLHRKNQACSHALPVHHHGARAAHPVLAAKSGRDQPEVFTKKIGEQFTHFDRALDGLAIDGKANRAAIAEIVHGLLRPIGLNSASNESAVISGLAPRFFQSP